MMILVTYDVETSTSAGQKRLHQVAKVCEALGSRVQNSVFELLIDPAQLVELKSQLIHIIDQEKDSIRFYHLGSHWQTKIETMGRTVITSADDVLIL